MADSILKWGAIAVGGYFVLKYLGFDPLASVENVLSTSGAVPTNATTTVNTTNAQNNNPSASSLGAAVLNAATNDAKGGNTANQLAIVSGETQTTWGAWNYYTSRVGGYLNLPGYSDLTGDTDPGVAITFPQYWNLMGPWLQKNKGLSGLQGMGFAPQNLNVTSITGLGTIAIRPDLAEYGWGGTPRFSERSNIFIG